MKKTEENEVGMFAKVETFLNKNQEQFTKFTRLVSEINTFKGLRVVLAPMVAKQSEVTTGITADKKDAFLKLSGLLIKIASKALVWANDGNNQAMAAVFTIKASIFKYQSHGKLLIQAQGMADVLTANAAALAAYNVLDTDIAAINNSISACEGHAVAPGAASSGKKAATMAIKKILADINASLAIIDSLITSEYSEDNIDLVNEYKNNRRVDSVGIRHTGVMATFTDAITGKLIEFATISITSLAKTAISNIIGVAEIAKMRAGTYHIDFSANGYVAQMQDVVVARGKTVEVAILMVLV